VDTVDVAIIGGGVVGLASALAVATPDRTVCVLERHTRPGMETSTHNSGVIHAGIYYPPGTLKARLCIEGLQRLYTYCSNRGVPAVRTGKLILAEESQTAELERLFDNGRANGASELQMVDASFVRRREPHVRPLPGIYSPSTGVVEAEALVRALADDCRDRDVIVLPSTSLIDGTPRQGEFELSTGREVFRARAVVNAAGLYADQISALLGGESFRIYPMRGEYAELIPARRSWLNGLVYPIPGAAGHLGTHLTKTTYGGVLVGPSARYQDARDDYEADRRPIERFFDEARHLMPDLTLDDLRPAGSGIRAKLHPPEQSFADFMIRQDSSQPGLIHAAGIDSPGLTSCLAIGEMVGNLVRAVL